MELSHEELHAMLTQAWHAGMLAAIDQLAAVNKRDTKLYDALCQAEVSRIIYRCRHSQTVAPLRAWASSSPRTSEWEYHLP
ncbi:hypothetical protein GCM10007860_28300 [Chitiniphilus shinanonensis]|uniref:Uncharacterized protein n=1 Tax=Chitiniphilus shinanonensis TaxID=553088 RepID=A0ABQ6C0G0_9NEIS|nr:hypothetical protein [Chitiniphilus shinanonensis]GLS05673.1 hypothetical protein GCM10007860_28300 [Chitiniphilus shinanonensis]